MTTAMFGWIRKRNPREGLRRRYEAALREARDLQRNGDIVGYAAKVAAADRLREELDALDAHALDTGTRHSRT